MTDVVIRCRGLQSGLLLSRIGERGTGTGKKKVRISKLIRTWLFHIPVRNAAPRDTVPPGPGYLSYFTTRSLALSMVLILFLRILSETLAGAAWSKARSEFSFSNSAFATSQFCIA